MLSTYGGVWIGAFPMAGRRKKRLFHEPQRTPTPVNEGGLRRAAGLCGKRSGMRNRCYMAARTDAGKSDH